MREKFHIFVQLNYKYVESLPLLFSKYFWQGFIRQHLIWTWDKSLLSSSKPKSIVSYLNWLYGTNIDESMNEIYQKPSTLRLILMQWTMFCFLKNLINNNDEYRQSAMFYTFRFACFTKKELARMIDLIQKWILFPVQIVKVLNAFSICYSLLYMPE